MDERFQEERDHLKAVQKAIRLRKNSLQHEIELLKKQLEKTEDEEGRIPILKEIEAKERKVEKLSKAEHRVYFGRVDLSFDDLKPLTYYFGTESLDLENANYNVTDWRNPVYSLYIRKQRGKQKIKMLSGDEKNCTANLITRVDVCEDEVIGYENLDSSGESRAYLSEVLAKKTGHGLTNIVPTMSRVQDDIAREDLNKAVWIEGAPGTGKTSAALHRASYLTYAHSLKGKDLLLIAPNELCLAYMNRLLPDLGVDGVAGSVFNDFAKKTLNIEKVLPKGTDEMAKIKESPAFQRVIDAYIPYRMSRLFPDEDICACERVLLDKKVLKEKLDECLKTYRANEALEKFLVFIREQLTTPPFLSNRAVLRRREEFGFSEKQERDEQDLRRKNPYLRVYDEISAEYDLLLEELVKKHGASKTFELRKKGILDRKKALLLEYNKEVEALLKSFEEKCIPLNPLEEYQSMCKDEGFLKEWKEDGADVILKQSLSDFSEEDLGPMLYLYSLIETPKKKYRHLVIDEAQKLSYMQVLSLTRFAALKSFTIVADWDAAPERTEDKEAMIEVFGAKKRMEFYRLAIHYRGTEKISKFCNKLISRKEPPEVIQSGGGVLIEQTEKTEDFVAKCAKEGSKDEIIAVLCRDDKECEHLYKVLPKELGFEMAKSIPKKGARILLPVSLALGLEFDRVIIPNCSDDVYPVGAKSEKLLYLASTRARRMLCIGYEKKLTSIIQSIKED